MELGRSGDFCHVRSLRSFLALNDFEFNLIALREGLEARATYRAEVHEDIWPSFARYEAKSLGVVEPFDRTRDSCHFTSPLRRAICNAGTFASGGEKGTAPRRVSSL